jgi:hypothetical protein
MTRRLRSLAALVLVVASCTGGAVGTASKSAGTGAAAATASSPPAGDLVSIGAGLDGLAGLSATVYATGLTSASAFAIDPEGRLWVGTADYTDSGKDGIYLVPSAGATPIEVISDAHTPLGLLWDSGSLYVAAAGGVDAYSAFNGTTFADKRTILTLPGGVGEVNGLVLGPDGRMRLGVSSPCDSCTPTLADSAAVLSFNPDGTDLQVEAGDIRAPVGLAYYPGTSDLLARRPEGRVVGLPRLLRPRRERLFGRSGAGRDPRQTCGGERRGHCPGAAGVDGRHVGDRGRMGDGQRPSSRAHEDRLDIHGGRCAVPDRRPEAGRSAAGPRRCALRRRLADGHHLPDRRGRVSRIT